MSRRQISITKPIHLLSARGVLADNFAHVPSDHFYPGLLISRLVSGKKKTAKDIRSLLYTNWIKPNVFLKSSNNNH